MERLKQHPHEWITSPFGYAIVKTDDVTRLLRKNDGVARMANESICSPFFSVESTHKAKWREEAAERVPHQRHQRSICPLVYLMAGRANLNRIKTLTSMPATEMTRTNNSTVLRPLIHWLLFAALKAFLFGSSRTIRADGPQNPPNNRLGLHRRIFLPQKSSGNRENVVG